MMLSNRESISPGDALDAFGLYGSVTEVTGGYSGELVYLVEDSAGKAILKAGPDDKTFIHDVVSYLAAQQFDLTPKLIPQTDTSNTIYQDGQMQWEAYQYMPGEPINNPVSTGLAASIGVSVGRFHASLVDYPMTNNTIVDTPPSADISKSRLAWWRDLRQADHAKLGAWGVATVAAEYVDLVQSLDRNELRELDWDAVNRHVSKGIIHRDLYGRNIFAVDDAVSAIIDFDQLKYGPLLDDIARIITEFGDNDPATIDALVTGYSSEKSYSIADQAHLPLFIQLRYLRAGFYMLKKALSLDDDLSGYPESLRQRLESCVSGLNNLQK